MQNLLHTVQQLTLLDYGFLALLSLSIVLGALRGFVHVVMSLLGWLVALYAAHYLASWLAPHLTFTQLGDGARYALAFVVLFVVTLILWGILAALIKQAVHGIGLGSLDHALGAVLGVVRGLVLLTVGTLILNATPVQESTTWQKSSAVRFCLSTAQGLQPWLPTPLSNWISSQ